MAFVEAVPHRTVMNALQPHLGPTRFLRWSITSDAYPPTWEDALARAAGQSADEAPPPS